MKIVSFFYEKGVNVPFLKPVRHALKRFFTAFYLAGRLLGKHNPDVLPFLGGRRTFIFCSSKLFSAFVRTDGGIGCKEQFPPQWY